MQGFQSHPCQACYKMESTNYLRNWARVCTIYRVFKAALTYISTIVLFRVQRQTLQIFGLFIQEISAGMCSTLSKLALLCRLNYK